MFYVTIGETKETEQVLYYPSDREFAIFETELHQVIGDVGTFIFKIPATNPFYGSILEHRIITIYRDDKEYWRGFIREIRTDFDKSLEVYCIEDMGFLAFTNHTPLHLNASPAQLYLQLLKYYNSLVGIKGTSRTFEESGYINNYTSGNYIPFDTTYEMTLLDCFRQLCGKEYFLKVRRKDGKRYLDLLRLENYGKSSSQDIFFGENLLDYARNLDTSEMLNVLHPYGNDLDKEEIYEGYAKKLTGKTLQNTKLIEKYGRIEKSVFFDTDDINALNSEAEKYFNQHSKPHIEIELTAVDMSELSIEYENLEIGDKLQVFAEPFGYNGEDAFPIIEKTTDIQDLSKNALVLSDTMDKLKSLTEIQGEVVDTIDDLPKPSAILDLARKQALAMLDNTEGGYVSFEFDKNNQMVAMHIADDKDLKNALKDWVWGMGGLGFRTRSNTSAKWQEIRVALTADGHVVADRIFASEISGDNMLGGTIKIGGTNYGKNGEIIVYNTKNKPIITINSAGITLTNQMKIKWDDVAHPAIPADISDLSDKKSKLWTTIIANNWIQSAEIYAKFICSTLLWYNDQNYINFGEDPTWGHEWRKFNGQWHYLRNWINVDNGTDCFRVDEVARVSSKRYIASQNGDPDASNRIEYTHSGLGIVRGGTIKNLDADRLYEMVFGNSPDGTPLLQQLYAWARGQSDPFRPK